MPARLPLLSVPQVREVLASPAISSGLLMQEEMAMTRVFVLTNHKGGVGKSTSATTIALGLGGVLAQHRRVQLAYAAD
jgi:Mrp family chromosome partitioning ATPase